MDPTPSSSDIAAMIAVHEGTNCLSNSSQIGRLASVPDPNEAKPEGFSLHTRQAPHRHFPDLALGSINFVVVF